MKRKARKRSDLYSCPIFPFVFWEACDLCGHEFKLEFGIEYYLTGLPVPITLCRGCSSNPYRSIRFVLRKIKNHELLTGVQLNGAR